MRAAGSLAALDPGGAAVGFHALPPLSSVARRADPWAGHRRRRRATPPSASSRRSASTRCGSATRLAWCSARIVCQVVNEAAFALGEGVGSAEDIDAGMVHGLNYPRGILAWADEIGLDHVLSVLDGLYDERREERYRAAPLLRQLGMSGRLGRQTGEGFFVYED